MDLQPAAPEVVVRQGILASVLVALFLAGLALWALRGSGLWSPPPERYGRVAAFSLIDQRGQPFSSDQLHGSPWVADFIFTRCTDVCPVLTTRMSEVVSREGDGVRYVSFSVDPDFDTPEVLEAYAARFGSVDSRWSFLTGDRAAVQAVADSLQQAVTDDGAGSVLHSERFVLVDGDGQIRGFFPADGPGQRELGAALDHVRRGR